MILYKMCRMDCWSQWGASKNEFLNNNETLQAATCHEDKIVNEEGENVKEKMNHANGRPTQVLTITYIKKQTEVTAVDVVSWARQLNKKQNTTDFY